MKIIDLSMTLSSDMKVYPGDPEVKIEVVHDYEKESWRLRALTMGSHTGTHVDAFSHMHKDLESLDNIPLDRFMGQSMVVKETDEIEMGIGLFFVEPLTHKYLDKIINLKPLFVGGNISESVERILLKHRIVTYTNLINLELIEPLKTFMFYGLPLKIKDGDGSPVRAIAIIDI